MRYVMIATAVDGRGTLQVWPPGRHPSNHLRRVSGPGGGRGAGRSSVVGTLVRMADVHSLSPEAHSRLQAELEKLTGEGRIDIARKIETARELGDLSENGDYHAAKDEQGKMEARIRQLEALLLDAVVVEGGAGDGKVRIGSIEERGGAHEVVSPKSPLGAALLGEVAGTSVTYDANGNDISVEIVSVEG